jgi:diacylglycerol kinase (ATP)
MNREPRVVAITNPQAGGNPTAVVNVLQVHKNLFLEEIVTTCAGGAEHIAREQASRDDVDVIVAVGGDGTASEVARGLQTCAQGRTGCGPALLVAPGGTGNSNYRCLWNDDPWPRVVHDIFSRGAYVTKHMDMAAIVETDKLALLGMSAGLLSEALSMSKALKSTGRQKLAEAALTALQSYNPFEGRICVDEEIVFEGGVLAILVGGSRYRGGCWNMLPRSILDDGLLDVCIVAVHMPLEAFASSCLNGTLHTASESRYRQGREVSIERLDEQPLIFDHDGELASADGPLLHAEILPAAVKVLASPVPQVWSS